MASSKISALTDGGAILNTDQVPVNRGGSNFRVVAGGLTAGSNTIDSATGDGSTTVFTLSASPAGNNAVVAVNGLIQTKTTDYAISGTTLTFTTAPANADVIQVFFSAPAAGTGNALTANPLSQFAATTSAQLRGVLSDETGTGVAVFATSPTLVTPLLGTPTSGTLTNCTGLPVSTGVDGMGTGVATFLATPSSANLAAAVTNETGSGALVFATSPTLVTPVLGTPASGALTNCTAVPAGQVVGVIPIANLATGTPTGSKFIRDDGTLQTISGGGDALTTNPLSQFAATTSLQLKGVISDETGSGALVFATSPTLVTPALGTPSSGALTNCTAVPAGQVVGVIPIANLATGTPDGSKFIRDDGTLQAISGGGDALVANPLSQFAATTSLQLKGVISDETGSGALVFATSPTLVTPVLGVAAVTSVNKVAITAPATSATITVADGKTLTASNSITIAGTDSTVMTFPSTSATIARSDAANTFTGTQTFTAPVLGTPASGTLSSCTVDGTNLVGYRGAPQNSQSTAYTTVLGDAGKCIFHPVGDNNARTFTIDSNANVAYVIGTIIEFINMAAASSTIAITSDTMTLLPAGTTGSRTLAQYGRASAEKITSTSWIISGNSALT